MSAKVFLNMPFFESFEIRLLPVVFELALVARDHRVEPEVHRAHVERGDLGLEASRPGLTRSSTIMVGAPPVVMFTTTGERCLITLRNGAKASGV